jgi:hypothetical protein
MSPNSWTMFVDVDQIIALCLFPQSRLSVDFIL